MTSSSGFSLVELMVTVAVLGILASIASTSYATFTKRARDSARIFHLGTYKRMLEAEHASGNPLKMTTAYGELSYGGWDSSATDVNGNGQRFLDFLGPNQPVDPLNNSTGDLWAGGAGPVLTNGFAYQYYCYPSPPVGLWGSPSTWPIAVIITRLEETNRFYWIRVDNVECAP